VMDGMLIRSVDQDLQLSGDGRTVKGILAPYNEIAEVNDGFGPYLEMYKPGCFERCIRGNAQYLRVQLEHDGHWVGRGDVWRDGPAGLAADLRLDDTEAGREAAYKIRDKQTPGLSLMFQPSHTHSKEERVQGKTVMVRHRVKALRHVAICQEPCYAGAQIEVVRSQLSLPTGPPPRLAYWQEWTERVKR